MNRYDEEFFNFGRYESTKAMMQRHVATTRPRRGCSVGRLFSKTPTTFLDIREEYARTSSSMCHSRMLRGGGPTTIVR